MNAPEATLADTPPAHAQPQPQHSCVRGDLLAPQAAPDTTAGIAPMPVNGAAAMVGEDAEHAAESRLPAEQ